MSQSTDRQPTHLSAFLLEQATGLPIRGLPCYAEVSVAKTKEPAGEPDHRFDDLIANMVRQRDSACAGNAECQQRVLMALELIISRRLPSDARDRLLENVEEARQLFGEIIARALNLAGTSTFSDLSSTQLSDALNQATQQVAEARHLPLQEQPVANRQGPTWSYPLGIVASDHAGDLSFDLLRLPADVHQAVAAAVAARCLDPGAPVGVSLWLYPLLRTEWQIDALAQNRFAPDAILARLDLDPHDIPALFQDMGLLAMQCPSLTDWQLSPASFAANPRALLGEDGCETLLPANLALQEFFFSQVVQLTNVQAAVPESLRETVKLGVVHEYRLAWYALGHSLGQILYSLPLAPGESVNLAVIDWTRRDDAQRKEQTHVDEQLIHNEHRDRTITETVDAAVKEYQHGSSFMGGLAGSAGVGAAVSGSVGLAAGLTGSLGGSTASSDGSRDLAATTVQRISDNITQASSAMRELQSTVVVQSVQAEKEAIETRTVVNYNHSHALTILYYEVLRHFRLVTELAGHRPAVLVRMRTNWFEGDDVSNTILENRAALEGALLDPKYSEGFNALQRIARREQLAKLPRPNPVKPPPPPFEVPAYTGEREFLYYTFAMTTGGYFSSDKQFVNIRAGFLFHDGSAPRLFHPIRDPKNPDTWFLNPPGSFHDKDQTNTFTAVNAPPGAPVPKWEQVTGMLIDIEVNGGSDSRISFKHIKVTARDRNGIDTLLIDQGYDDGHLIITESTTIVLPTKQPEPRPLPAPRPAEEIEDDVQKAELLAHLYYHKAHYSRAILFQQNVTDRALALNTIKISGDSTVLDYIENRPLELIGEYLAYPCTDPGWASAILQAVQRTQRVQLASSPLDERLVTLPTRGVFAEAKLGHCNASEEIDNTRFWDWQQSPIPHLAPEIAPVQPVTPQPHDPNLQPTPFPTSLVNIVNPPAAPDPTGMAAALSVLATPNIFRDMSGQAEVADLLKRLSDNTIGIAEAADRARAIQNKYGSGSTSGGSGLGSGNSGGSIGGGSGRPTPYEQHDQLQVLRNAERNGDITGPRRQQLADTYLDSAVTPTPQMASFPSAPIPPLDPNIFQFRVVIADDGLGVAGGWMETECLEFGFAHSGPSGPIKQPIPIKVGVPLRNKQHGKISVRFAQQETADAAWFAAMLCKQALDNGAVTDGQALVALFRKVMQQDLGGDDIMPGKINGSKVTGCSGGSKRLGTFDASPESLLFLPNPSGDV